MHVPVVFLSFGLFIHTQVLGRMEMAFSPLFQSTDWITLLAILLPLLLCVGVLVCCYCGPKTYTIDPVDLQAVLETKGGGTVVVVEVVVVETAGERGRWKLSC